ncbi:MAG: YkgJ family cysteine cluster protein [Chitinophagaceae bacterium]
MKTSLVTDLSILLELAPVNEEANEEFYIYLKSQDDSHLDELVHRLNVEVSAQIDCTQCGNCCRSLIINIDPLETHTLSGYLDLPLQVFKEKYVEESQQGQLVVNTVPCHFLENNKCTIYEHRFLQCREFPHLHKTGFQKRLQGTLLHYGNCPIVFNVIEELKAELSFRPE